MNSHIKSFEITEIKVKVFLQLEVQKLLSANLGLNKTENLIPQYAPNTSLKVKCKK